jgi:hypothetical protein
MRNAIAALRRWFLLNLLAAATERRLNMCHKYFT